MAEKIVPLNADSSQTEDKPIAIDDTILPHSIWFLYVMA
jgi:hypothetical protein